MHNTFDNHIKNFFIFFLEEEKEFRNDSHSLNMINMTCHSKSKKGVILVLRIRFILKFRHILLFSFVKSVYQN